MRRIVAVAFAFVFLLPVFAQAQEVELSTYTNDQRWERAASQFAVSGVAAIAYAKTMGQSVQEYAETVADLFAPGWGEPGSGSLAECRV